MSLEKIFITYNNIFILNLRNLSIKQDGEK